MALGLGAGIVEVSHGGGRESSEGSPRAPLDDRDSSQTGEGSSWLGFHRESLIVD